MALHLVLRDKSVNITQLNAVCTEFFNCKIMLIHKGSHKDLLLYSHNSEADFNKSLESAKVTMATKSFVVIGLEMQISLHWCHFTRRACPQNTRLTYQGLSLAKTDL